MEACAHVFRPHVPLAVRTLEVRGQRRLNAESPSPSNGWGVHRTNVISRRTRRIGGLCGAGREEGSGVFLV